MMRRGRPILLHGIAGFQPVIRIRWHVDVAHGADILPFQKAAAPSTCRGVPLMSPEMVRQVKAKRDAVG